MEINFKDCCTKCVQRKTYVNENKVYCGDGSVYLTATVIGCEHEKVCKEYIDSEGAKLKA